MSAWFVISPLCEIRHAPGRNLRRKTLLNASVATLLCEADVSRNETATGRSGHIDKMPMLLLGVSNDLSGAQRGFGSQPS
jgi:hypothetical protein